MQQNATIRKGRPSDASTLADIFVSSLKGSPWWNYYYRPAIGPLTSALDAKITKEVQSLRRVTFREALCGSSTYITIASINGDIAGFARWIAPSSHSELHRPLSFYERLVGRYCNFRRWILNKLPRKWYNWLFVRYLGEEYRQRWSLSGQSNNAFFNSHISAQDKSDGFWYLSTLMIKPAYQRLGIGSMLMKEGLERIDKSELKAYTAASLEGRGLYEKMGFESVAIKDDGDDQFGQWVDELMCYTPKEVA